MNRYTLIGFLRGLALVPIAATLAASLGRFHWLLDIFTSFHLQYAIALLMLGVLLMGLRRFGMVAIIGITLLWNGLLLAPYYAPQPPKPAQGQDTFRLISFNVHTGNDNHVGTLQYLQQQKVDAILLLEVDRTWANDLAALESLYPYHLTAPRQDNFGIALYARWPMTAEIAAFGQTMPSISATLMLSSTEVHLIGTHPLPPTGSNYARRRDRQMADMADAIAQMPVSIPRIVAGDFNASPWSASIQPLFTDGRLRDAALGFGVTPTWFAVGPIVSAPIDHVLVSSSIGVGGICIGPDLGSDHRPVLANLTIGRGRDARFCVSTIG